MKMPKVAALALAAATVAIVAACGGAARTAQPGGIPAANTGSRPGSSARTPTIIDSAENPFTQADVDFMSGMIPHHAQAVLFAGWATSHGARNDVRILCERIVVGQRDEIRLMRSWLAERGRLVPDSNATHHRMTVNGMVHDMLMPGMLTDAELAKLDSARGPAFDRLFLTYMIKHHLGAIIMVEQLLKSPGAAQDETVFRFSADVYADQGTEIDRMQKILAGMGE
jgi:uncharacterized protein (DUF305 family)